MTLRMVVLLGGFLLSTSLLAKTLVMGAGPSGLYATYLLREKGIEVEVVEKQGRPGGKVYSEHVDKMAYEMGAVVNSFVSYRIVNELLKKYEVEMTLSKEPLIRLKNGELLKINE